MNPIELKERLDRAEDLFLLDVREPEEFQIANIGGKLIPLQDLSMRFQELDPEKEIVVICHHGVRSVHAINFLRSRGFQKVRNLDGGIDRWSVTVDPTVMRY